MKNSITLILILFISNTFVISAQTPWPVPEEFVQKLSIQIYDEEIEQEGKQIYRRSCTSCHGTPTEGNFTLMSPTPGDVSEERFIIQKDGELLYKIQKGRGTMPAFENSFSEAELWSLVAYIRSFHPGYIQEFPDLEGIEIPKLTLQLEYDENVDKLVIHVSDDKNELSEGVNIKAYVKGMFGNHFLGNAVTNEYGIAYVGIDALLPGDEEGYVTVLVKASKGYGAAKLEERIQAATPTIKTSIIEGRHLWSRAKQAPIWMIVMFNLIGVGIWLAMIFILVELRKIKKLQ